MADGPGLYGFRWGPLGVVRVSKDARYHTLIVYTDHQEIEISVSNAGRAVHVTQRKRSFPGKSDGR